MQRPQPYIRKPHYYETDKMGIIHHSNYIRWFEEARVDYMDQLGYSYDKTDQSGVDIAVLECQCAYKSMVRFGDTVRIHLRLSELSNMRMKVVYRIEDADTGELRTTGYSSHCFFDRERNRPTSLKLKLPELYDLFEAQVETEE